MKKEKKLFECESNYNFNEEYKFYNTFKLSYYYNVIIWGFIIMFVYLIFSVIYKTPIIHVLIVCLLLSFLLILMRSHNKKEKIKKVFNKRIIKDITTKNKFYETYLIRENDYNKTTIFYKEINKIVETKDNFYLISDRTYIFQKDKCSSELIEYIQNMNVKNYIDYSSGKKVIKKIDSISAYGRLSILFIIIILLSFLPVYTMNPLINLIFIPFCIWIIILSRKYQKIGINTIIYLLLAIIYIIYIVFIILQSILKI